MAAPHRLPTPAPNRDALLGQLSSILQYDAVLLPCGGSGGYSAADANNLRQYADQGGRVFLTHGGGSYLFELTPAKLPHYVLPLYPALAWLVAAALTQPLPRRALWGGVALSAVAAVAWSVVCIWLLGRYGNASDQVQAQRPFEV